MSADHHVYCTEQTFFIQINPAEIRKNNPVVAAIDDFIENHISLEIFSAKCGNSVKGAPAMHAGMMLKVIFYCYSTGCFNRNVKLKLLTVLHQRTVNSQQKIAAEHLHVRADLHLSSPI